MFLIDICVESLEGVFESKAHDVEHVLTVWFYEEIKKHDIVVYFKTTNTMIETFTSQGLCTEHQEEQPYL